MESTIIDEELSENEPNRLRISISGNRNDMTIGKYVIRLFDSPAYMGFRVNKERNSLIVFPCQSKEVMSFKVPKNIFGKNGRQFRITSKSFVHELIEKNGLSGKNFVVPGTYLKERNLVMFNIADGYEHTNSVSDEL